jgi:16S rRNA (guanine1516-N2)-methyltransferase
MMVIAKIVFFIEDNARKAEGECLALKLQLPLVENMVPNQIVLTLTKERLELRFPGEEIKPVAIDFFKKSILRRLQGHLARGELIAHAVGIKGDYFPTIIDATAGFGVDALILAHLGCQVTMIERSPIICALLADALERAKDYHPAWLARLNLYCLDAKVFLERQISHQQRVDVVYLDPMFPRRMKSALVKKEMRILTKIVGSDEDAENLFDIAKQCAKKRVVVKRPRHAKPLAGEKPSTVFHASASRFDVYILKTTQP